LPPLSSVAFAGLASGLLVATVTDLRTRRIPNTLTAAMAVMGFGLATAGVSGISPVAALAGLALGLALMLPGYALGATGAGDVKLMAAVGAIVGPAMVVMAYLFTGVAGGVLAVVIAIRRRRLGATIQGTTRLLAAPSDARNEIQATTVASRFAYGPAIAIGSLLAALLASARG
jgi:prepilin peptidase CpaA